jgi:hypothetical protein
LQHEGAAAEEDGVLLEEDFEGLACDLAVEEEVFMVQDEEKGGGTGFEVL